MTTATTLAMEVNGLMKHGMPPGCGNYGEHCFSMGDVGTAQGSPTSTIIKGTRAMAFAASNKRQHSCNHLPDTVMKGALDNVIHARAKVQQIEDLMATHAQQHHLFGSLQEQLFNERIQLIDALVLLGWERYHFYLKASYTFDDASTSVRNIYEEALDISVEVFNASPHNTTISDRLLFLLVILDFDDYGESLVQYQMARASMNQCLNAADAGAGLNETETADLKVAEILKNKIQGPNALQQVYELWKNGVFEKTSNSYVASEEDDELARVNATGMCLMLFRNMESSSQSMDQSTMERQFRYLFDEYLPNQLSGKPSIANLIATKYDRLLFQSDGSPTVYWSLLVDMFRKEWVECFHADAPHDDLDDMDTDDEDDGR